jgi:hypothetical protein
MAVVLVSMQFLTNLELNFIDLEQLCTIIITKVKVSGTAVPVLTHHIMKICEEGVVCFHRFLTLALDRGGKLASTGHFTP